MAKITTPIYLSYSQICVFLSTLTQPFNDWSDRNFSQGFSWRPGSASFRALVEEGNHQVNLLIDELVPSLPETCVRAFKVPFETLDGNIEIASISDSESFEIPPGKYALQVEFLQHLVGGVPEVNIRLNKGHSGFEILKADSEIDTAAELDLLAQPAT